MDVPQRLGRYDDQLVQLAGRQHFVVSRQQLLEIGSARQLKHRLRTGFLERVYRSAYRLSGSPDTLEQRLMAACFASGKPSVASFRTAAFLDGLPGGEALIEITSPRWRRVRYDGVIPHESHHLTELDVRYVGNIPVTRTARTINDLGGLVAVGELRVDVLDRAMHEAVRRDLVDTARVWREWERLGGTIRPSGKVIEAMLDRFVATLRQPDTSGEAQLLRLILQAGLPHPTPQLRVWLSETRWVDLDFGYRDAKVFAEFDPYKWHGARDKYMKDAERLLELRRRGWDGVSVTDDELDAGAPRALEVLRSLLELRCVARGPLRAPQRRMRG
jgi:hypothetical protein